MVLINLLISFWNVRITFSISCWIKTSDDAAAITGVDQSFVYWLDNHELRFEVNNGTWKQPITYNVANKWMDDCCDKDFQFIRI